MTIVVNKPPEDAAKYDLSDAITKIVKKYDYKPTALIMILQDIQSHYNYLPKEALEQVSQKMNHSALNRKGVTISVSAPVLPVMYAKPRLLSANLNVI